MSESVTTAALYSTVWLAVASFVVSEAGKRAALRSGRLLGWPWAVWSAGGLLLAVHIAIALDVHHGWSHQSVVRTVEEQTRLVYGMSVGAGAWINYLFLSLWLAEAAWWRLDPAGFFTRPRGVTVVIRAFYALVLVNGAIVFAAPSRRIPGALLMLVLFWTWRDTFSSGGAGSDGRRSARINRRSGEGEAQIIPVLCVLALAPQAIIQATPQAQTRPNLEAARVAAASIPRLNSLLVSWRGSLVLEYYGKGIRAARPANVKSVSKSVISALVGIAIERRLIPGLSTPLTTYFPQLLQDPAPQKRKITIEDLLTMRSGLESTSFDNYGSWVRSRNWVQYALAQPVVAEPGQSMEYSTGSTHLLSAILTKATRLSTYQFAQEALAKPLGFTLAPWPRDPQGIYFGGNEMLLTPRQMVTFGELYLRRGAVSGRQIVPAAWVETSCVPRGQSRFNPDQRYGYGWWTRQFGGHDSCFAWGFGGQYIFVFRDLDLVVVTTSTADVSDERRDHRRLIFDVLERVVIPEIEAARTRSLPNS